MAAPLLRRRGERWGSRSTLQAKLALASARGLLGVGAWSASGIGDDSHDVGAALVVLHAVLIGGPLLLGLFTLVSTAVLWRKSQALLQRRDQISPAATSGPPR